MLVKNRLSTSDMTAHKRAVELEIQRREVEAELARRQQIESEAKYPDEYWHFPQFASLVTEGFWNPEHPHLKLMAQYLERIFTGEIKRLMIFLPPRHLKSLTVSHLFASWYLIRRPDDRVMLASYNNTYASTWGKKVKETVDEYGEKIGLNIKVSHTSKAKGWWDIAGHRGGMYAAGVGGAFTGREGNLAIIDDPIKNAAESLSPVISERNIEWYRTSFATRLKGNPAGAIIVVMTRWQENDLAGQLLEEDKNSGKNEWVVISLPALATEDNDILGRKEGDALCPSLFTTAQLLEKKKEVSDYWFNAMYQQSPSGKEGGTFKLTWMDNQYDSLQLIEMLGYLPGDISTYPKTKYGSTLTKGDKVYTVSPGWGKFYKIVQSVDAAWKTGVKNDFSVIQTWGWDGLNYWLLDEWRGRVEFPELQDAIEENYYKWRPEVVLIEDAAAGIAALQEFKRTSAIPVEPYATRGASKIIRADIITPVFKAGKIILPHSSYANWIGDFKVEFRTFPAGKNDDRVDTAVMAISYLKEAAERLTVGGHIGIIPMKNGEGVLQGGGLYGATPIPPVKNVPILGLRNK